MAIYLLGRLSEPQIRPTKHIPVGIVGRDEEDVEVRTIPLDKIPPEYQSGAGPISQYMLKNLDVVFKNQKEPSSYDTSLFFYEIGCSDDSGTLKERVDRLFEAEILPHYKKNDG